MLEKYHYFLYNDVAYGLMPICKFTMSGIRVIRAECFLRRAAISVDMPTHLQPHIALTAFAKSERRLK